MRAIALAATTLLIAGMVGSARGGSPYTIPAHWVLDSDSLGPRVGDFSFADLNLSANGKGWIAGGKFFLNVGVDDLRLTFVNDYAKDIYSVAVLEDGDAWAGGCRRLGRWFKNHEALMWRHLRDEWRPMDLSYLGLDNSCITKVRFANASDGWALADRYEPTDEQLEVPKAEQIVLRFNGHQWTIEQAEQLWAPPRALGTLCSGESGEWWAAGRTSNQREVVLLLHRDEAWREVQAPTADLSDIACLPEGGIVTLDRTAQALLRYQSGRWDRLPFPGAVQEQLRGYWPPSVVAAIAADNIWTEFSGLPPKPNLFLHIAHGDWQVVPGPVLPGGRRGGYSVTAIQFVSPTEGWAIAQDSGGPDLVRGLVFHYKHGVWENWNWNWHFWDERWFGLFGH